MTAAPGGFASQLEGRVIPAVPVPFDAGGTIDHALHRSYVEWMRAQPVGAVAIWAHTGRGPHLEDEQRQAVLDAWIAESNGLPVICGVGVPEDADLPASTAPRTAMVLRAASGVADQAKRGGAAAIMAHPPRALRGLEDEDARIVDYHRALAEVGLPVVAFYLYEAASGLAYSSELVERILAVDGVVAIKVATLDSVITFQDLVPVVRASDRLLITGEDRFLGYSLSMGSRAALIGLAAACPDVPCALLKAGAGGRHAEFDRLTSTIDAFAAQTFVAPMEGYVQRMLWAIEADGVWDREAYDPFGPPLDRSERARVFDAVRNLRHR